MLRGLEFGSGFRVEASGLSVDGFRVRFRVQGFKFKVSQRVSTSLNSEAPQPRVKGIRGRRLGGS